MDLAHPYRDRIAQTPGVLGGMTEVNVLTDYPHLTRDDLRVCLAYAADALRGQAPIGS